MADLLCLPSGRNAPSDQQDDRTHRPSAPSVKQLGWLLCGDAGRDCGAIVDVGWAERGAWARSSHRKVVQARALLMATDGVATNDPRAVQCSE